MSFAVAFVRFWYDFVVGDDWRMAVAVVIALAATLGLVAAGVAAWWLLPVIVFGVLALSLWIEARRLR